MSQPKQSKNTSALDAVEKTLDQTSEEAAISNDETEVEHGDQENQESGDSASNTSKKSKQGRLSAIIGLLAKVKQIPLKSMFKKCHLQDDKKDKLKKFATSNVGITVIVLFIIVLTFSISALVHHHSGKSSSTRQGDWSTSVSEVQTNKLSRRSTSLTEARRYAREKARIQRMKKPATIGQVALMMKKLGVVSDQMKRLNQRMMVISEQLTHHSKHHVINKQYRILGWRLDQDTNQWVTDIEYNGQVKAYYSGQHFGRWTIRSVTANGVKIK